MLKSLLVICFYVVMVLFSTVADVHASETDTFADILKKVDGLICTQPENITAYYSSKLVIMTDDKRALLKNRVQAYRQMMSDFRDMKCRTQRKVLSGSMGTQVGYVLVDEIVSVTSKSTDADERQHSVCSYVFSKEKDDWKISLEHCSSLPDYSIGPGDDALYYFHNPIY